MSNYQRTLELTGYATNSAGASNEQFSKTTESLESKLNRLHNAWEAFTTGIANDTLIKGAIDLLTDLLTQVNNLTDSLPGLAGSLSKVLVAFLGFKGAKAIINKAFLNVGAQMAKTLGVQGQEAGKTFYQKMVSEISKMGRGKSLVSFFGNAKINDAGLATSLYNAKKPYEDLVKAHTEYKNALAATQAGEETYAILNEKRIALKEAEVAVGKEYTAGLGEEITAENLENAVTAANTSEKEIQVAATLASAKAKLVATGSTATLTEAEKMALAVEEASNMTRLQAIISLFGFNSTKRVAAAVSLGLMSAEEAEAIATEGAAAAQTGFNAALYACPIMWIIAGVAALTVGLVALAIALSNQETELDKQKKRTEEVKSALEGMTKQVESTKKAYDDLLENKNTYNTLYDELKKLSSGTEEFKKKATELETVVSKILEEYPELYKYASYENGVQVISEQGLKEAETKAKEKLDNTQIANSSLKAMQTYSEYQTAKLTGPSKMNLDLDPTSRAFATSLNLKDFDAYSDSKLKQISNYYKKYKKDIIITEGGSKTEASSGNVLLNSYDENGKIIRQAEIPKGDLNTLQSVQIASSPFQKTGAYTGTDYLVSKNNPLLGENVADAKLTGGSVVELLKDAEDDLKKEDSGLEQIKNQYSAQLRNKLNDINSLPEDLISDFAEYSVKNTDFTTVFEGSEKKIDSLKEKFKDNYDGIKELYKQTLKIDYDDSDIDTSNKEDKKKAIGNMATAIAGFEAFNTGIQSNIDSFNSAVKTNGNYDSNKLTLYGDYLKVSLNKVDGMSGDLIKKLLSTEEETEEATNAAADYFSELTTDVNGLEPPSEEQWNKAKATVQKHFSNLKDFLGTNDEGISELVNNIGGAAANELASATTKIKNSTGLNLEKIGGKYWKSVFQDEEDVNTFVKEFGSINWQSPIDAAYALEHGSSKFSEIATNLKKATTDLISTKAQFSQVYNAISSDDWDDLLEDGEITKKEVEDLKDEMPLLSKALDNTGVSSKTLATYLQSVKDGLVSASSSSLNFIEALDKVNAATTNIEESVDFVKDFKTSETQTKIGDNFSTWRDSMKQSLERGQYGDQQLIDYSKMILGEDNFNEFYAKYEGNLQKVEQKAYEVINSFGQNFYGMWSSLSSKTDVVAVGANGQIQFDLSKVSSLDDLKKIIMEKLDVSEEFAEAAIADAQTYSTTLTSELNKLSLGDSLKTLLEGAQKGIDGTYLLSSDELKVIATQADLTVDEIQTILQEAADKANIKVKIDAEEMLSLKDNKLSAKSAENYFQSIKESLLKSGETVDFSSIYTNLLSAGLDSTEARNQIKTFLNRLKDEFENQSFTFNIDGSEITFDKSATEKITDETVDAIIGAYTSPDVTKTETLEQIEAEKQTALSIANGISAGLKASENLFVAFITGLADALGNTLELTAITKIQQALNGVNSGSAESEVNKIYDERVKNATKREDETSESNSTLTAVQELINLVYNSGGTAYSYNNSTAQDAGAAGGSWPSDSSSTSSSTSDDEEKDDWVNDWNMEYAILKKIAALEKERTKLDKEHNRWVKSYALLEDKITKSKEKQRDNLKDQISLNEDVIKRTRQELEDLNNSEFAAYIWYDQEHNTIRTDDAGIRAMDEDTKGRFDEVKSNFEDLASQLETADDNIESAVEALEDLQSAIEDADYHTQFENLIKVLDHNLTLYEKAETRLERIDNKTTSQDFLSLYNTKSQERIEKNKLLTEDYITSGSQLSGLLNRSDIAKYYDFDWDSGKLTRNSAYYTIVDPDIKSKVDEVIEQIETLAEQRRSDDESRESLADEQYEAQKAFYQKSNEWLKSVYEVVLKEREEEITKLENVNTSIQDAASKLIDSMQKSIQKVRQDRKNEKTEQEISDIQAKLSYLQADTSGANEVEIKKLEKQLSDQQESYTDTLIDQKITELQDQNKEAAEQRKTQIEIAKAQLQYDKQTGALWKEVRGLIAIGLSATGNVKRSSELGKLLSKWGGVSSLSDYDKEEYWAGQDKLGQQYKAYQKMTDYTGRFGYSIDSKDYYEMANEQIDAMKTSLSNEVNNGAYGDYMLYNPWNNTLTQLKNFPSEKQNKSLHDSLHSYWAGIQQRINFIESAFDYYKINDDDNIAFTRTPKIARHKKGGLVDYTGLHWLDGTPSDPELVLNAKDTKNFIALKDILSGVMKNSSSIPQKSGDINCEVNINVDSISSDYDVDQIVARVQYNILQSANWRNVNNLSMMR